jgi:hypothetical protein
MDSNEPTNKGPELLTPHPIAIPTGFITFYLIITCLN